MSAPFTRRRALGNLAVTGAAIAATHFARAVEAVGGSPTAARRRPKLFVFDVIETLFDPSSIDEALTAIGLPKGSLKVWFPRFLRDAFALEVIGEYKPFRDVATGSIKALGASHDVELNDAKVGEVLAKFATLPAHPDVKNAFEAVRSAGVRMITLTNGSRDATQAMLKNAGLDGFIERSISIDEVRHWKPSAAVYRYAADTMKLQPHEIALIAAHDWDTAGASRAGFLTGGVQRGSAFSVALPPPDFMGKSIVEPVKALLALPA